jgi:hypothetical protein
VSSSNPALGGSMLFGELNKRKRILEICVFQEKGTGSPFKVLPASSDEEKINKLRFLSFD